MEPSKTLNIVVVGHVDSGKSTISGAILILSGYVSELDVKAQLDDAVEHNRESWYMAYFMDINEEEKEKGKTVEMGRASFETQNKRFTLLDCPGHRNYVQNMISGAAQADVANLVISAKPGEFEAGFERDGQTKEHAMLAKALGARFIIVLVNKMDLVNWSEERFKDIKSKLEPFLIDNCHFDRQNIFWVILSGLTREGINSKVNLKQAEWYSGKCLFDLLNDLPKIPSPPVDLLRIPILDKFSSSGVLNSVCRVTSGIVKPKMECMLMPIQKQVIIQKVLNIDDKEMAYANAGETVNIHIKGIDIDELKRGYVICGKQYWCHLSFEFEAEVTVFDLPTNKVFCKGLTSVIHLHTILETIEVTGIWKNIVDSSGLVKKIPVPLIKSGETGIVRIQSERPLCLEKYEEFPDLGRFALRQATLTIASGKIIRIKPANSEILKNNSYFIKK